MRNLKVWTTLNENLKFFAVPYDTVGTVIEVERDTRGRWCRVLFPQGVGWVTTENLMVIKSTARLAI